MAFTDTPDIYKENVLEIVANWLGYPLKVPGVPYPAEQAGIVELRCFINNVCPFTESPRKEDIIIFNDRTMARILPKLPDKEILTYTPGLEGIHFFPRYVYRHNYIFKAKTELYEEWSTATYEEVMINNFDRYYQEVNSNTKQQVPGAFATRYRQEQSWIVDSAVFESESGSNIEECADAEWYYQPMTISASDESLQDQYYDYTASYFAEHAATLDPDTGKLKEGESPKIVKKLIQVPVQTNVYNKEQKPVHWKLYKRTPLYRGEDFFIRFFKKAKVTNIDTSNEPTPRFNDPHYDILDVKADRIVNIHGVKRRCNNAVVPLKSGTEDLDSEAFNLYNQAYYLIELGLERDDANYFILITEKNPPVFIMRQYIGNGDLSRVLSAYDKVKGAQLINADDFLMTVRNHLGKIVIQFEVGGSSLPPWVIQRTDWYPRQDPVSGEIVIDEKFRNMSVPRGRMTIWGGNLRCGFAFGPLQYKKNLISFVYPPQELDKNDKYDLAFDPGLTPENVGADYKGAFESNPFFLPSGGSHHVMLSSASVYLEELEKFVYLPNEAPQDYELFTQDAQFYSEYHEQLRGNDPHGLVTPTWKEGYFFYGPTIKEFPDAYAGATNWKHSLLTVKKYRYLNDESTRHQAFDVIIGMMCGDHIYTNTTWSYPNNAAYEPVKDQPISHNNQPNTPDTLFDTGIYEWMLPNCKTPILTHMRLIADESPDPRWEDGTTVRRGISKTPLDNTSPYFFDATDHVMNYSESWSANSWAEVEHTGTLQFYLNREMTRVENNVTDLLLSLQNKSFYVDIWAGYRNCSACKFVGLFKLFTGVCHGGTIDYQYNKNILTCKVEDYTTVLRGERFFNSPWYDGMKDINAIWEILQMVGFRSVGKYDSGRVIRGLSDMANMSNNQVFFHHWDGRPFKMEPFALPSGYNRLEQPGFKFNDGEALYDAIVKISQKAAKTFYFDQFGQARYEDLQDVIEQDYLGRVPLTPLFYFTTNPEYFGGMLVHNKVERSFDVKGISNHIKILSNTPDFHILVRDALNWHTVENPAMEGFLGFKKTFYQAEGMFGSKIAVVNAINKYKVMWRPKVHVKFETYGLPLRANDIISLNGEVTRVIRVNHNIDARQNQWWMEVECMRYQPIVNATIIEDNTGEEYGT